MMPTDVTLLTLDDIHFYEEIPEPYQTLEENAEHKASTIFDRYKLPVFAEDSGLFVEALDGRPGVYSARYAGMNASAQDHIHLLLTELGGITERKAFFKTVISYINGKGEKQLFDGICEGHISNTVTGEGGFGYDPVFVPAGHTRSFAQMSSQEKNSISHRKKAMDAFLQFLFQEEATV